MDGDTRLRVEKYKVPGNINGTEVGRLSVEGH